MEQPPGDIDYWQPDEYDPRQWSYLPRFVVKFHDNADLPYSEDVLYVLRELEPGLWGPLLEQGLLLTPLFDPADSDRLADWINRAAANNPEFKRCDHRTFFVMVNPPWDNPEDLVEAVSGSEFVETAHIKLPGPDPAFCAENIVDRVRPAQAFLGPAPVGIDAEFAWQKPGGDGSSPGVLLIDLERGWTLEHEDLAGHQIALPVAIDDLARTHGTSVLGIICPRDNQLAGVGIVPNVNGLIVVSYATCLARSSAIAAVAVGLPTGSVVLLEAEDHVPWNGRAYLAPIEVWPEDYNVISTATSNDVVVVEAGGNGSGTQFALDFDAYTGKDGNPILNRTFRDSGAIIVSTVSSAAPHRRLTYAPHGERIDCYAWGQNIPTCCSTSQRATNRYTTNFDGTSGASAIIAGAALAVQSLAIARHSPPLAAQALRALLADPNFGTLPDVGTSTHIGVMPDLRKIVEANAI